MISTIPLSELEKYADNIYEAIVIIAKRAKQINEEQKRLLEQEMEITAENEEFEEEEVDREALDKKYIKFPKPTRIALEEMLSGKLRYEYREVDEEVEEE